MRCSALKRFAVCCSVLQCVAVCCSVLQCVAECCSALQCVAVCCSNAAAHPRYVSCVAYESVCRVSGNQKFSKVSSLPNCLYKMNVELIFEKFHILHVDARGVSDT